MRQGVEAPLAGLSTAVTGGAQWRERHLRAEMALSSARMAP